MPDPSAGHSRLLSATLALLLLTGCAWQGGLRPFRSDGCSLFPDRSLSGRVGWCGCCVEHDRAYWRGGTREQRLAADLRLRECVLRQTGDAALARTMYLGTRLGGTPGLPTGFRWAYGWPFGRHYQPLTPEESTEADRLEQEGPAPAQCR